MKWALENRPFFQISLVCASIFAGSGKGAAESRFRGIRNLRRQTGTQSLNSSLRFRLWQRSAESRPAFDVTGVARDQATSTVYGAMVKYADTGCLNSAIDPGRDLGG